MSNAAPCSCQAATARCTCHPSRCGRFDKHMGACAPPIAVSQMFPYAVRCCFQISSACRSINDHFQRRGPSSFPALVFCFESRFCRQSTDGDLSFCLATTVNFGEKCARQDVGLWHVVCFGCSRLAMEQIYKWRRSGQEFAAARRRQWVFV
ncbi:hypothetical protein BC567DRAFT_235414 [Phyllosticta citribraziliensis]